MSKMGAIVKKVKDFLKLSGDQDHEKLYSWIFWFLLIIIFVILYIIGDLFYHCGFEVKYFTEINGIVTTLMTVIGIFIAFTAINIYSIFNSRVDEEKESLIILKKEYESKLKSLKKDSEIMFKSWKKKYKIMIDSINKTALESKVQVDEQTHIIKSNIENINKLRQELLISISINNIVTDHIPIKDKGTAIGVLIERVNFLEKKLNETDYVSEKKDIQGQLIEFVKTVFSALNGYYQTPREDIKNTTFKKMLDSLTDKLQKIMKKEKIEINSSMDDL